MSEDTGIPCAGQTASQTQPSNMAISVGPITRYDRRVVVARGGGLDHRDAFNVNRAEERRQFIGGVADKLGVPVDQLRQLDDAIVRAADEFDSAAAAATNASNAECAPPTVSAEVAVAADNFLANPCLFDELLNDFLGIGIVGEQHLALAIYLIGTSRLLSQPLSGCVQAASATGKSYIADRVLELFPCEELVHATDLTTNALYYFAPGALQHKIVFAGERRHGSAKDDADVANAGRALREMISSRKLTKCVPLRGADGKMTTQLIEQDGPIAYIDSTTEARLYDEDATRVLALATDESAEQTCRVIQFQAAKAAGQAGNESASDCVKLKHQTAQRQLRQLCVRIPYAMHLAVPANKVAARRLYRQLLGMIEAIALLRQRQKGGVGGQIEADLFDYRVAHYVMQPILNRAFAPLSERARALYTAIRANLPPLVGEFSRDDCKLWIGLETTEVRNRLNALVSAGLVEETTGRQGVAYRYRIARGIDSRNASLPGLITPDELEGLLLQQAPAPVLANR